MCLLHYVQCQLQNCAAQIARLGLVLPLSWVINHGMGWALYAQGLDKKGKSAAHTIGLISYTSYIPSMPYWQRIDRYVQFFVQPLSSISYHFVFFLYLGNVIVEASLYYCMRTRLQTEALVSIPVWLPSVTSALLHLFHIYCLCECLNLIWYWR